MSSPIVSVIITVYNRASMLPLAVESVLVQSLHDFELIILDDASTDDSFKVAQAYTHDSRVHIYQNDTNLGDYPSRKKAASFASGKYLKYVDSDDLIYPHCLQMMVGALEAYPSAGLAISKGWGKSVIYPVLLSSKEFYENEFLGGVSQFIGPTFTCLRQEAFEKVGGFSGARHFGDTECWLRMAARYDVVILATGLAFYRVHPTQELATRAADAAQCRIALENIVAASLTNPRCPLEPAAATAALDQRRARVGVEVFSSVVRRNLTLRQAVEILRGVRFTSSDVLAAAKLFLEHEKTPAAFRPPPAAPNWQVYPNARTEFLRTKNVDSLPAN